MKLTHTDDMQQMSARQTVEAYLAAFAEGKVEDIIKLLDDNVVWHIDGDPLVSTVGLLKGPDQVRRWLQDFPLNFRPLVFSINDIITHNDSVLVLGYFRHIVLSTGNVVGSDMIIHFRVSRAKITHYQMFEDSALLRRAFDVSDQWQQQVRINGTLYRYLDIGEGPTLIFAHGLFANHEIFSAQLLTLRQSYRCIVLDMPGHGMSEYDPGGWKLDDLSRDLALMIQELSLGKVTLIGQSQGGMVAMILAAHYPQLISRLVLIGTSARAEFPERLENWRRQREILLAGSEHEREDLFKKIQAYVNNEEWLQNNQGQAARELHIMLSHDRSGLVLALDAAVLERSDLTKLLADISAPTLIICGEQDAATPVELSQEIASLISEAKICILPGIGHHPTTEASHAVTATILQFLKEACSDPHG
ncbi:alpha/beta fold hydrolase [Salmonella enterica]|nr:alpha/beta fold hydrolase [Salmonella enterica]EHX5503377.1 alpha/beta fold hydrolase [Salmonella enterica]EII0382461.1 alpha/beta fold hydrolase [Salmonella enterica]ELE3233127.1 alpha/beta fold hydrolase [Salmonella enterica subsp. enterica serovar Muenchen]